MDKASKTQKGFQYHVRFEHNVWNYLFFISYLRDKEKTEYSGFESFVAEKMDHDDISWFPLHQYYIILAFTLYKSLKELLLSLKKKNKFLKKTKRMR